MIRVHLFLALCGLLLPCSQCLLRKQKECSQSLGCISNPESTIMLTWEPRSELVHFSLRGYVGNGDLYVAMGLSYDSKMGDDDVVECVYNGGDVQIFTSYNVGKTNVRYLDGGLSNQSGIFESGTMQCYFTRPVEGSNTEGSNSGPKRHDLNQDWHVMLVWGQMEPGTDEKQRHVYRSVSSSKVSMKAVGSFETAKLSDSLIHLHGCAMLVAWITMTSVGIIIARHYKGLLSGMKLCGKDVWFQVHRALMVLVLLLTLAGVAIIFVEVGGYREITNSTEIFELLHPIFGLCVTGLAILNPVIALFRPTPTSPRRPVFNWVHRCVGTGCHVLALVTIFFGLKLKKVLAPMSVIFALGGFILWHITIEILFFCVGCFRKNKFSNDSKRDSSRSSYTFGEKQASEEDKPQPRKVTVFQEILLMMHSAIAIATTIFVFSILLSEKTH